MIEIIEKLQSTTLQSYNLTNSRLKYLSSIAQISEDHISRVGLGLSLSEGSVDLGWTPQLLELEESNIELLSKEKQIRGRTLFKDDLPVWMALILNYQIPKDYSEWRLTCKLHWERGVQLLTQKSLETGDWLRTIESCLKINEVGND